MCGIMGYVGGKNADKVILAGLRRLEYRGYDSAGLTLLGAQGGLTTVKTPGKVAQLEAELASTLEDEAGVDSSRIGIGHTRWATHGAPSASNAHPHVSPSGRFAIAHNGIIDNYLAIRQRLEGQGSVFASETDSEVVAHLVESLYDGDLQAAVLSALEHIKGTYGLVVISAEHPDTLVAARNGSPIVVGVGKGETLIASDVSALISHTNRVVYLDDGDVVIAKSDSFDVVSVRNEPVSRGSTEIDWDIEEIEKGGFDHFMLKEIYEQPMALTNATRGRLLIDENTAKLSGMQMDPKQLASIDRVMIAACGTSMYAGMVGKYYFEDFSGIPADIVQAAEFRDRNPMVQRDSLMLAVSQSGETADTLAAVRESIRKGATTLGVCNVVGSTIARECGRGVYLHAGPEISVASTKAFTSQVTVLAMMSILLGRTRRLSPEVAARMIAQIEKLPELTQGVLDADQHIASIAEKYAHITDAFFIGRGYMYPAALEGALKLKEISYVHAEGYHAAELKHGPIALLGEDVPVVVAVPESSGKQKTIANMQECRARKSPVIAIATEGDDTVAAHADDIIYIPRCSEFIAPIPVVVAEQLFSYHMAKARGCEIDQPRNLAKSVTVE